MIRPCTKGDQEGEKRASRAAREGAEYVGDLGTFNGARLAATSRKGIRYFPLFTTFPPFFLFSHRFPLFPFFPFRKAKRGPTCSKNHRWSPRSPPPIPFPFFSSLPVFFTRFPDNRVNVASKRRLETRRVFQLPPPAVFRCLAKKQRDPRGRNAEERGRKALFIIQSATN